MARKTKTKWQVPYSGDSLARLAKDIHEEQDSRHVFGPKRKWREIIESVRNESGEK